MFENMADVEFVHVSGCIIFWKQRIHVKKCIEIMTLAMFRQKFYLI